MASSRSAAALVVVVLAACATAPGAPGGAGAGGVPLAAADGSTTTLDALRRDRDALVLVFWSASCPCVRRYQARVDALLDAWPAERVRVVGVSSNVGEAFPDVLRAARERGVRIPLYRDEGGALAAALAVRSTPSVAVVDRAGAVRFVGWLDNERLPGDARREPWLDRAIAGVLAGRTPFAARSPTWGCAITRSLRAAGAHAGCAIPPEEP